MDHDDVYAYTSVYSEIHDMSVDDYVSLRCWWTKYIYYEDIPQSVKKCLFHSINCPQVFNLSDITEQEIYEIYEITGHTELKEALTVRSTVLLMLYLDNGVWNFIMDIDVPGRGNVRYSRLSYYQGDNHLSIIQ